MHTPVLVLNANYEPINVCSTRRAIVLILTGKATLVLNGRGEIRTVSWSFPRPSVIRLAHMVPLPRQPVKLSRREIFRRDNYTCQYCGRRGVRLTIDHVIPKRLGGTVSWENLVTACAECNHRKGGRPLSQTGMRLLRQPKAPTMSARYRFAPYLDTYREWETFIEGW